VTRALVTGGAGMVGSHLTARLIADGVEVVVLDDLSSGHRELVPPQARFLLGSVVDDDAVQAAFDPAPDEVFHLAALFANQNSVEHPVEDLAVNGLGTLKVLRAATSTGVRKVLYTSSSCVYGGARPVMSEEDGLLDLDTPYAVSKLLGEHYSRLWAHSYGLDVVIARLFNCYGPHEHPGRYRNGIPNFLQLAMRGEPLPITGSGEETRDFTYVGDTVEGLVKAMAADTAPAEVFNFGSGRETSIRELADMVNAITGSTAGVVHVGRRSWDQVSRRVANVERAVTRLQHRADTSLHEGLASTYAWLRAVGG
jgi:nucleoside-diphosphate-sugar epimerase